MTDVYARAAEAAENATHIMSGSVSTPWINRDEFRMFLTRAGLAIVDAGQEAQKPEGSASQFYTALNAANFEYSAMSWSGFNVFGDRKSINEVGRLTYFPARCEQLETLCRHQREELGKLHARAALPEKEKRK
jgi:hypothetical protein